MTVDRNWIDHIDAMDQLRKGISLRAYGQVDPIISYKKEGFDMFDEMIARIQRTTISVLLKVKIEMRPAQAPTPMQVKPAKTGTAPAPAQAQPVAQPEPRRFRRQMPTPLSQMSSYKNANNQNNQSDK